MDDALVRLSRDGPVATVLLARPDKLNALTPAMLDALEQCARALDRDADVRAIVLGAQGRAFCVGADIEAWSALRPLDMWRTWVRRGHAVFDQWAQLRPPVIAAVHGAALGGGLELALTADIRVAAMQSVFALPEASIGTCPGWSGSQRLVALVGASRAKYLALTGERLTSARALEYGLVHEVVKSDDLEAHTAALARRLCAQSPVALQLTKQLVNAAAGEGRAAVLEAMAGALAGTTQDAAEGIASFREKRAPVYRGL